MEHYIIEHDRRRLQQTQSIQWPERMLQGYSEAANEEIVFVKSGKGYPSPCVIDHYPVQLFTEEIAAIMLKAEPELQRKRVVVMNLEQQNQTFYDWIDLPKVFWMNPDRIRVQAGQVTGVEMNPQSLEESSIWCIPYYRSHLVIVRLDVAEKLLKAGIYGLNIRPIRITEGEE